MVWVGLAALLPEVETDPILLSILTVVAPVLDQLKVVDWPGSMVLGVAVRVAVNVVLGGETVTVVESLGHERHVVCRLDDGTMVIVRQPSSDSASSDGSGVRLSLSAEHLHVFDATSGVRVAL